MNDLRRTGFRKLTLSVVALLFCFSQVQAAIACMAMDVSWMDACETKNTAPAVETLKTVDDCCKLGYTPLSHSGELLLANATPAKTEPQAPATLPPLLLDERYLISKVKLPAYLPTPRDSGAGIVLTTLRLRI